MWEMSISNVEIREMQNLQQQGVEQRRQMERQAMEGNDRGHIRTLEILRPKTKAAIDRYAKIREDILIDAYESLSEHQDGEPNFNDSKDRVSYGGDIKADLQYLPRFERSLARDTYCKILQVFEKLCGMIPAAAGAYLEDAPYQLVQTINWRADLRLRPAWKSVSRSSKVEMMILVKSIICDYDSMDVCEKDKAFLYGECLGRDYDELERRIASVEPMRG
jgi:hypothetical protein